MTDMVLLLCVLMLCLRAGIDGALLARAGQGPHTPLQAPAKAIMPHVFAQRSLQQ